MKTVLLYLLIFFYISTNSLATNIDLSEKEKEFIKNNPVVTVGMMPDFSPFTYYIKNTPVGFEHDILKIITERTGLEFEKKLDKWTNIYNSFKTQKLDMISSISYKKYREPFTLFTKPYYEIPIMVFVNDSFGRYDGLESLKGKKVGVLKDVFYIKELQSLETMDIVMYDNYTDVIKDLVFGKIDALIQNLTNINHIIKENLYTNIKLASELNLPNTKKEDLRFGINPQKPLLSSIIQKALDSISKKEKEALVNKWIGSIKEFAGGHVELSKNETAFIDTNVIKYCINSTGMPFEGLNKKGEHIGISSDYYNVFEKILSAKFELVKTKNWNETISFIKEKKCDMIALGMDTPQRREYLNFTKPYLKVPLVVATRVNVPFINHIMDLKGEKIGIIKGDVFVKILRQKYPELNLVEVDDIYAGLDMVKDGQLFAYIDTLASIGYEFQSKYFGELKIAGKISENLKLSMAVVKDEKTLLTILQKAIDSISEETHREIFTKWLPIKYQKGINYTLVWQVAISAFVLILLFIYWNTKIIKTNKLLKEAKKDIEIKNEELEKLAITDKLTNIYNRRKIEELLEIELHRSERFYHTFGLAIVDIDYFKKINDTFGHQIGDKVLIEMASILKTNLRKTDFLGRYGGEEFLIICPESELKNVENLMETLKEEIATHNFKEVGNKTASFGVTISKKDDTKESILQRADKALYQAKSAGRNKVVVY